MVAEAAAMGMMEVNVGSNGDGDRGGGGGGNGLSNGVLQEGCGVWVSAVEVW